MRGLARGDVRQQVGIVGLGVVHPAGRAGRDHGQHAVALDAVEKLGCLLHDGEVGAEVGVIDLLEAEALEGGNHLAGDGGPDGIAELLSQGGADGGSGLDDDVLARDHGCVDLVDFGLDEKRSRGADAHALPAHEAGRLVEREIAGGGDERLEATLLEAKHTVAVGVLAALDAAAAEDALAGIADDRGREIIVVRLGLLSLERALAGTRELRHVQELAVTVLAALLAVLGMVRE